MSVLLSAAALLWLLMSAPATRLDAQPAVVFSPSLQSCNGSLIANPNGFIESEVQIPTNVNVAEMMVDVDISASAPFLLELQNPAGNTIVLFDSFAFGLVGDLAVSFWDYGSFPDPTSDFTCNCPMSPMTPLDSLLTPNNAGTWTLSLLSFAPGTSASINNWCLSFYSDPLPHPVNQLQCSQPSGSANVAVNWVNNENYSSISVWVNGAIAQTLSGAATSATLSGYPLPSTLEIAVEGVLNGLPVYAPSCVTTLTYPSPTNLSCIPGNDAALGLEVVELSWANPVSYSAIEVWANGVLAAALAGDATRYTYVWSPAPTFFEVRATIQGVVSDTASCFVDVPAPPPTNLLCGVDPSGSILVTWDNPVPYEFIFIDYLGGSVVVQGSPTPTQVELPPPPGGGPVTITWTGIYLGGVTAPVMCTVFPTPPLVANFSSIDCQVALADRRICASWFTNGDFDAFEVYLGGALVATLPGTASSFASAPQPPLSDYVLEVRGLVGGAFASTLCQGLIPATLTGRVVVIDHDNFNGTGFVASTEAAINAMIANQRQPLVTSRLTDLDPAWGLPALVWVARGSFPDFTPLTVPEGQLLADYVVAGVPVVYEAGGEFFTSVVTPFCDYDGIESWSFGDMYYDLVGSSFGGMDLTTMDAGYTPDMMFGTSDGLVPTSTDLAGPNAAAVWLGPAAPAGPPLCLGVFYDTNPGFGKVLRTAWEFGGYQGDQNLLMQMYLDALEVADAPQFLRADVDNNGVVIPLVDAVALLNYGFMGGRAPQCLAAADVDSSGQLSTLPDAIYLLLFGFAAGAPVGAPYPQCGIDNNTIQQLGCLSPSCP